MKGICVDELKPEWVRIRDVSLWFELAHNRHPSLKEWVIDRLKGRSRDDMRRFLALDGITLDLRQGDRIGLVGRNGAGKSTLLKTMARIYKPSAGRVEVKGHLVPLLEMGVGFNGDLSGEDNVIQAGAIMGYNRAHMRARLNSIFDFAELQEFRNVPIKYYSSGMGARLAFTLATEVEPQVLLLDEIFSIGDAGFVRKAQERMKSLIDRCEVVVLVSHDAGLIAQMCNRGIYLERGKVRMDGEVAAVLAQYQTDLAQGAQ